MPAGKVAVQDGSHSAGPFGRGPGRGGPGPVRPGARPVHPRPAAGGREFDLRDGPRSVRPRGPRGGAPPRLREPAPRERNPRHVAEHPAGEAPIAPSEIRVGGPSRADDSSNGSKTAPPWFK